MACTHRDDTGGSGQPGRLVALAKMPEQGRHELMRGADVGAHLDLGCAQHAGFERNRDSGPRRGDPQRRGKLGIESAVQLAEEVLREGRSVEACGPSLAREMGERQLLQIALAGLRREVAAQRGLDVMHPRMLALDQVGVIAMHPSGDLDQVLPERDARRPRRAACSITVQARSSKADSCCSGKAGSRAVSVKVILPIYLPIL